MPKTICELQGGEGGLSKYKLGSNGINEEQNDLKRIIIQSRGKERIFLEDRESLHSLYLLRWEEGILKVYMIRWQRGDILKLQIYIHRCFALHIIKWKEIGTLEFLFSQLTEHGFFLYLKSF